MSDLYIAILYCMFIVMGVITPFVASLGYVWVDTFYPQFVSLLLKGFPVALVMGAAAMVSYALMDRRSPPRPTLTILLTLAMAVWVTLTTTWAVVPDEAWLKWNWAFKTVAFSAFIPLFIRSRVQIEAFIQVFLFSVALHILPYGIKAFISGGGYGKELGLLKGNSGLAEGSTLAGVAIMCIPLLLHLRRHSLILPNHKYRTLIYSGYVVACCTAPIATVARTALIGFAVLGSIIWMQSRHKLIMAVVVAVAAATLVTAAPDRWKSRMSTVETYDQESSAMTRILVWRWTIDYATDHPLGGGFSDYLINHISDGEHEQFGRAFHSIYFEVLGEHGWIGFAIFMLLILNTIFGLRRIMRRTRDSPELAWCNDLARAVFSAFLVILACGAFVGVAFQPMLWYLFAITTSISEYVRRAQRPASARNWMISRGIVSPSAAAARSVP